MKNKIQITIIVICAFTVFQLTAAERIHPKTGAIELDLLDQMLEDFDTPDSPAKNEKQTKTTLNTTTLKPVTSYIDSSLVLFGAAGGSTATDTEISGLQTGAHDPTRRGFTFQGAEFSLSGVVDPYFTAQAHAVFSESAVELEEAYITTTALPLKMQLEVGYFLTEFGRLNPRHVHEWQFVDQPIAIGRFFGSEGQRSSGFRLSGLFNTSWFSEWHIGMQSPTGGLTQSFRTTSSTTIASRPTITRETQSLGDMISLIRFVNGFSPRDNWETQFGLSGLFGPNSTGTDSNTLIFGADLVMKWTSPKQRSGWPFFQIEGEFIQRNFEAAAGTSNGLIIAEETLKDWGWYLQASYGFKPRWYTGLRLEQAGGKGASFNQLRSSDTNRSDRLRCSPVLGYKPSEYSRVLLQYNYDDADHLTDNKQHTVWLSTQILIGKHPAHNF